MKKFAYVAQIDPSNDMLELAAEKEIELVFINLPLLKIAALTPAKLAEFGRFDGIVLWSGVRAMEFQFDYEILLITETKVENEEGQYQLGIEGHLFTEAKSLKNYKQWYSSQSEQNTKLHEELESIHQILDNLPRPPARSAQKTEENQWPVPYSLATRLAAWFGSR